MARELREIDISDMPDVLRIVGEVEASGESLVLRRDARDIAVLMPLAPSKRTRQRRAKSKDDMDAFRAAAGTWADVDTDELIQTIYDGRISSKPPVDL